MTITTTEGGNWLPFLLQTADPLFPTGSYAHSFGWEEMARLNCLRDEQSLLQSLRLHTIPALRDQELPYLRYAYGAALAHDMDELCLLDREIDAWKLAQESREASVQIGLRRLRALENICQNMELLRNFEVRVEGGEAQGHHLVVFAMQAVVASVPREAALFAWAYQGLASVCAAALKLIRIGQDGIQRTLRAALSGLDEVIASSLDVDRPGAGTFSPLLEIASMRHRRAEERLFIS